jgi:hypothetical protein
VVEVVWKEETKKLSFAECSLRLTLKRVKLDSDSLVDFSLTSLLAHYDDDDGVNDHDGGLVHRPTD